MTELLLFVLMLTKHFVADFPLQNKYQYLNKGTYFHLGGVLHSGLHGLFTFVIFIFFTPFSIAYALVDFVMHYNIDWIKVNINKKLGYTPTDHEEFWWLLGADQYLHQLTYAALIFAFAY